MPVLSIHPTKRAVEEYVLACMRPDGSIARQHYCGPTAIFFPKHDLTHYVVETAFGMRRGFYGLVAESWNLGDFGTPWPRGKPPADADPVEDIVHLLDRETDAPQPWTAEEFNSFITQFQPQHPAVRPVARVTDKILAAIRAQIREYTSEWREFPASQTMALSFSLAKSNVLC